MENLNEQIYRIRSMMGLLNEAEDIKKISNEKELIDLIELKGFEKLDNIEDAKNYKIDLNKYYWIYYHPKMKSYLAKFKDGTTMFGLQSKFDPKTQTKTSSDYETVKNYPLDLTEYLKFFTAPIIDESFDLDSIVRDLDSIRNMYYGLVVKDETTGKPIFIDTKNELNDNQIKVYKETIQERMVLNKDYINILPNEEDKLKSVTSEKFGETFNNVGDYHKFVEDETKNLGIYF